MTRTWKKSRLVAPTKSLMLNRRAALEPRRPGAPDTRQWEAAETPLPKSNRPFSL